MYAWICWWENIMIMIYLNNKGIIGSSDGVMGIKCGVKCFIILIIIYPNNKGDNSILWWGDGNKIYWQLILSCDGYRMRKTGDANTPQCNEEYAIKYWSHCWRDWFQLMRKFEIWMFSSMECTGSLRNTTTIMWDNDQKCTL